MTNIEAMDEILELFGLSGAKYELFGTGLINRTWKVYTRKANYILQKINNNVFKEPKNIAYNIRLITTYLKQNHPDYFFVAPVTAINGNDIVFLDRKGWFRLMPFVEKSYAFDVVQTPNQAYEAAKQFGRFTKKLSGFNPMQLKITIPHFHDLELRYQQFLKAVSGGNEKRINESKSIIEDLILHKNIVDEYRDIAGSSEFKLRVIHHDTKISNVLFDETNKGLCVIDLDTVMPGYFISDVGDMMRTYMSPVNEEEADVEKIVVRSEFFKAIIEGYSDEMKDELADLERTHFLFAGKFMVYMQALRFLTDHLNNDIYYGARYEGHNFIRAKNQVTLLQRLAGLKITA